MIDRLSCGQILPAIFRKLVSTISDASIFDEAQIVPLKVGIFLRGDSTRPATLNFIVRVFLIRVRVLISILISLSFVFE